MAVTHVYTYTIITMDPPCYIDSPSILHINKIKYKNGEIKHFQKIPILYTQAKYDVL